MNIHTNHFALAGVLSLLLPTAAAACTPDLTNISCSDQVKRAMNLTQALVAQIRIHDVPATPLFPQSRQPSKILPESASFSEEGTTMRWIYSTVAEKRIFAMYNGPQRGRPAELRVTVRLSLQ